MEKRVELLAPCGSYESFLAAVNAGADAVYLGGKAFGARAYAENFSDEELISVIRRAHLFGVKVYLTVNTLIKEREFLQLYAYLLPLYEAGLDGVIVQDMGVFVFLKRRFPDLKLHASTQMTITGAYGAAYLKKLGCERIVPARELSLQEIKAIRQEVSIEIEAFIHGAMCYCYSGQCLMSSMIGGRSGNRGRCAQPCRLPYKTAGKEGYYLSLKDMNTLEHIPKLIEAGIDSFKIEGRMKKPEYVAGVVSVYRKYIDRYYDTGGLKWNISLKDKQILSGLYIRSETGNGYYFRSRGREMLTLQKPGYNETDQELSDRLRETCIKELPKKALDLYVRCRAGEPLYGEVRLSDTKDKTEVFCSVLGPAAEKANKRAVTEEEIRRQLIQTGGTPFVVEHCRVELGEAAFVPMKWVKELRREILRKIYEAYSSRNRERRQLEKPEIQVPVKKQDANIKKSGRVPDRNGYLTIIVQTKQQFEAIFSLMEKAEATGGMEETMIVDADLLLEDKEIRDRIAAAKVHWGIKCPVILRKRDEAFLKKLQAFMEESKPEILYCSTMDAHAWIKSTSFRGKIAGEASLYAWNKEAVSFWDKELDRISIPLESDGREIRELCAAAEETGAGDKLETILYGRAPFMVSANCIKLSAGQCDKNRKHYAELSDRMGNQFPVYTNCAHCYNIIYNYLPTSYHENLRMLVQDGIRKFRIEFTVEGGQAAKEVLQTFQELLASELKKKITGEIGPGRIKGKIAQMETTQGCFHRSVE